MPGLESGWHWLILGIVVVALFGYKKLPDAARSLGRSLRIFKTEIKGMGEDDAAREATKAPVAPAPPAAIEAAAPTPAPTPAPSAESVAAPANSAAPGGSNSTTPGTV